LRARIAAGMARDEYKGEESLRKDFFVTNDLEVSTSRIFVRASGAYAKVGWGFIFLSRPRNSRM
jgi:hypothetical protein